jgi:Regulator of ribonuclease activity B
MSVVELLLETAAADKDLIYKNRRLGDNPEIARDLDFALHAKTEERARLVHDFVIDNGYGRPSVERIDADDGGVSWQLVIAIHATARPEVVCTLSAFMACLSKLYDLDYDGWGCVMQRNA